MAASLTAGLGVTTIPTPAHSQSHRPREWRGEAALDHLGASLPAVARAAGLSTAELRHELLEDPTAFVTRSGKIGYHEPVFAGAGTSAPIAASRAVTAGATFGTPVVDLTVPATAAALFNLSSKPGADFTIYIDVTGHRTENTYWNEDYGNGAAIVSSAFDLGGNTSVWDAAEIALVARVWRSVAEDYAPFNVNVTTKDPGVDALVADSLDDPTYGVRIVVSPTNWYNPNAGGVAYLDSFAWDQDAPGYCFTTELGNDDKAIGECVAHETGHTLGLSHDGLTPATEYYEGKSGWAPIMGAGFYEPLTQWSKGEYVKANNTEDDLAFLSSYLGYRDDDYADDATGATPVAGGDLVYGVISETDDVDAFSVTFADAGTLTAVAAPRHVDGDLDPSVWIVSPDGAVVATANPNGPVSASAEVSVSAGRYLVFVDGVGSGNMAVAGYSDYGSLGEYELRITTTGPVVPNSAPVAEFSASSTSGTTPLAVSFDASGSSDPDGGTLTYAWDFGNGATSSVVAPSTTYTRAGTYTVTLTVSDAAGATGTATTTITASAPVNQSPVAVASASPKSGIASQVITYSSEGSYDPEGGALTYRWYFFSDGSTSTSANPTKRYNSAGTHSATLTVMDSQGAYVMTAVSVTLRSNRVPVVKIAATPTWGGAPTVVQFSSAGTNDPDGGAVTYAWRFGNGTTSTSANPTATYTKAGTYTATLTARDANGGVTSKSISVVIRSGTVSAGVSSLSAVRRSSTSARVKITVVGANKAPVAGATVTVAYSGAAVGVRSYRTNAAGMVEIITTQSKPGTLRIKVTKVVMPTPYAWNRVTKSVVVVL